MEETVPASAEATAGVPPTSPPPPSVPAVGGVAVPGGLSSPTAQAKQEKSDAIRTAPSVPRHGNPSLLVEIPVQRLGRNPAQPRADFSEAELRELAASIRQHGVLQPLLVVRKPLEPGQAERFELVAGERRWRAAQIAGLATVPCLIHDDLTERERLEISLVENLQRRDLNPIEEGMAYHRLHTEFSLTHEEIASRVGKSRPAVSNTIRLLDLSAEVKDALIKREINYGQARALLSVTDPLQRQVIFEKMRRGEITAQALERMQRGRKPRRAMKDSDPELLQLERRLSQTLGTPVRIRPLGPGGVIEVDFFSQEELSGIIERIRGQEDQSS